MTLPPPPVFCNGSETKQQKNDSGVVNFEVERVVSDHFSNGLELGGSSPSGLLDFVGLDLTPGELMGVPASQRVAQEEEESGGRQNGTSRDGLDEGGKSLLTDKDGSRASETCERTPPSRRVAVIGAGPSGLVAARELVREGHDVVIYEQADEVGGLWPYDPTVDSDLLGVDPNRSQVHTSIYRSLRTNLPRELMGYLDYPFLPKDEEGRDGRRFPGHREVDQYLKEFAEYYDLNGMVKFGVKVEYVGPEVLKGADTRWVVKFQKSRDSKVTKTHETNCQQGELKVEVFDAVVVCNGHYSEPRIAEIPGVQNWPGIQMHSHNYRFPSPFQDKVVVVIGSSFSAQDITKELKLVAKEIHQCAREWTTTEHLTGDKVHHFNIWTHPMVERACSDGTVEFEDGTSAVADIILHCTGFLYSFPFLDTMDYISVEDNRVGPLYKHVFPPALAPSLSFVGLPTKAIQFLMMELQSRWIARVLSGKSSLPSESEMMADVKDFYEQREAAHFPKRHTHSCRPNQFEYMDWLAGHSGHEPLEIWIKEIYLANVAKKQANFDTYQDEAEWEGEEWLEVGMASLKKTMASLRRTKVASKGLSNK